MIRVLGKDFIEKRIANPFNQHGESRMLYPDKYYDCEFHQLSMGRWCLRIDSDYSFYDIELWSVSNLYPSNAYCFMFEHDVINNININEIVKKGEAKYLTKSQYKSMEKDLKSKGMIAVPTMMCNESQINTLVNTVIRRDREIDIIGMYNLFKQHGFNEIVEILDKIILNQV